jgi:polyisoprenyl-phosphate glycosyltransferase
VVPAHNERGNLSPLVARIQRALEEASAGWRVILVDDGSRDGTWEEIRELARRDSRVAGVKLSRNFGHQNALLAGLTMARGEAIITMDADLQHPPEILPLMVNAWREGARIVSTVRTENETISGWKRYTSRAFYRVLSLLAPEPIPPGTSDFRLLDRAVVRELLRMGESQLFLRGLVHWMGYRSASIPFVAEGRARGRTSYNLTRMVSFAVTGITSMSATPLRLSVLGGLLAALLCLCELAYVLYVGLVLKTAVPGWASILVVNTFFFAVLFLYLGILGEYVARIFENVKSRPRFLIEETVQVPAAPAPGD